MKRVSIVGFGRFGQTLYKLLKNDFEITIYNRSLEVFQNIELDSTTKIAQNIAEIYESEVIFYAVPISLFESVIKQHKRYFKDNLLIDVLSVKMYPEKVLRTHLKNTETRALLSHPLFGPDSTKNGFTGLPLVMDRFLASSEEYVFWKSYFEKKGIIVIEMSPRDHDKMAAHSQGLTHFIGRLLEEMRVKPTPIDTLGTKELFDVMEQTCNDTWELFLNLQTYNLYTKKMRIQLGNAYDLLYEKLLPKRIKKGKLIFGIQGGKGSFNEEALHYYLKKHMVQKYQIKYLYTTEKVLKYLHEGEIDFGLFAIQNANGGVVEESTYAMAKYRFAIKEEFEINICHFLMKREDVSFSSIGTVMAHDQVFKQCKRTLKEKYPNLVQKTGEGDYMDTAKVAYGIATGSLPKEVAILGPKILADMYGLDIVDENLQDTKENPTTFFLVKRKNNSE